ncbi:MAG TPA: phospholipase D-like domain-containing protein [Stackebrandtia sp.]|jgi:hypothetical protein|uniref:phospholipase D-like domain-containing protein n=1 Tax=Stackebrandtia sp. TaxID=2023065 RepID=UPI002D372061|nr:phospholipase D-like domain-containing protein [Stackebrandtia sp.]HZE40292.1 phospholipase D-like domain-containing protein [Stackebrandtia sp.]
MWKKSSIAVVVAALAGLCLAPSQASAAEPDPVMNAPVFNDPLGTAAEQNAIFIQFARLIDRVPAGERISLSFFGFDTTSGQDSPDAPDLTAHLIAAHQRGVDVQAILDQGQAGNTQYARLSKELGADDAKPSFLVNCGDHDADDDPRGCIGTRVKTYSSGPLYAYNHSKFATLSAVKLNDGSTAKNVVFTGSSNIGTWDADKAFNNMMTMSDADAYNAFGKYFTDLRDYRKTAGNNNYYTDTGSASKYRLFFFPRHERSGQPWEDPGSDTVYNTLLSVDPKCKYQETDGSWHQTDVRVAMLTFNRPAIAQKLAQLSKDGCWVDIVYSSASDAVLNALNVSGGPQLTKCAYDTNGGTGDGRVHSKYLLVDGAFDDDITPRVYTGSHNYAWSSLRQADETLMRMMGRDIHTAYLNNFWKVRDTCKNSR